MNAYLPPNRTVPKISVPVAPRVWKMRSTGTRNPQTIRRMHVMIDALGRLNAGAWDLLGKLTFAKGKAHPEAWTLMELYQRYERHGGDVVALRRELADESLVDLFEPFLNHVAVVASQDTADHYGVALTTLEDAEIRRLSHFTAAELEAWLDGLAEVTIGPKDKPRTLSTGTRRKYAAAASAFGAWLVRQRKLTANPMRDVPKPKAGKGRTRWLAEADQIRLVKAMRSPFREISALIHGTSLDVSPALALEVGAIDVETWGLAHVRPKTDTPHTLLVAEWARPFVRELVRGKLPRATVGEGISRWQLSDEHRAACQALKIENYWLRDARHSWAVRWAKLGGSAAQGAEQLGHRDGGVLFLKLYGRFYQSLEDRQRVEDGAKREVGNKVG